MAEALTQRPPSTRRHRRVALQVPVRLQTIDSERDPRTGRRCFRCTQELSGNLSRGGAFLPTAEPLSEGCRLWIEIELPDGAGRIQAAGRVAWSGLASGGLGVEFVDAGALRSLDRFLHVGEDREDRARHGLA